jgi:tyrosinase
MLIPKGTQDGLICELFVMISDYEQDKVDQELIGQCNDAATYCGVRDRKYPDRRAMGFPFDRKFDENIANWGDFLTPNMKIQEIKIVFNDRKIERPKLWNLVDSQQSQKLNLNSIFS